MTVTHQYIYKRNIYFLYIPHIYAYTPEANKHSHSHLHTHIQHIQPTHKYIKPHAHTHFLRKRWVDRLRASQISFSKNKQKPSASSTQQTLSNYPQQRQEWRQRILLQQHILLQAEFQKECFTWNRILRRIFYSRPKPQKMMNILHIRSKTNSKIPKLTMPN